jgi:elongation factor G
MKVYGTDDIRNVGVIGHGDTGKTSLVSSLLFSAGAVNRFGKVDDGTTITDFDEEEISRKTSISSALCYLEWDKKKFNVLDTPGYANFIADARAAMRVCDGALLCVHGVAGVQVQTEKTWKYAQENDAAVMFVVNLLDRERASFERTVEQIQERFSRAAVPIQIPIGSEHDFKGVVDLVRQRAFTWPGDESGKVEEADIPADVAEAAAAARQTLTEAVAETDDALMEVFFDKGELSREQLEAGLRKAVVARKLFPILCAAGARNVGAQPLLTAMATYLPSPAERGPYPGKNPVSGAEASREGKEIEPPSAFVFKTIADPYSGRISLFRVYSGTLKPDQTLMNAERGAAEKLGQISLMQGKTPASVPELHAGDIGAVAKLKDTRTGDTLADKDHPIAYEPVHFPTPAISFAIEPKTKGDEEKISNVLQRLCEEDPVLKFGRDSMTHELLLSGTGLEHVKVAVDRMKKKFGVEVSLKQPKVPYRETIRAKSESMYRHKKQTGGAGQFAEVHLRVEPLPRGGGFEFASEVFGGAISRNFWPSIEKGVRSVMERGVVAGYPVVDVKAIITDGKEHPVDSKDIAFQVAGREVFKLAVAQARPVVLEPIMAVEVTAPEECMGDIMGDLSSRRGKVQGMEAEGHTQIIKSLVPLAEMLEYAPTLKSMTSDRGSFTMELDHYSEVPAHIQEKLIAAAKASLTAASEEE